MNYSEALSFYLDYFHSDAKKVLPKIGGKRPGKRCGKGWVSADKKCKEHYNEKGKLTEKGKASAQELAEKVRKRKGLPSKSRKFSSASIPYKPFMTETEAAEYTKDSAWAGEVFAHGSRSIDSLKSIAEDGVDPNRAVRALYGQGFYLGGGDTALKTAESFASGNGGVLLARLKVKNPLVVTEDEFDKFMKPGIVSGLVDPSRPDTISKYVQSKGYDALKITANDYNDNLNWVVIYNKEQLAAYDIRKSSTGK